jgi:diguanylate cyclase (GGDEF)-like protein
MSDIPLMDVTRRSFADDAVPRTHADLRQQIAATLVDNLESVTSNSAAGFPFSGSSALDPEYCLRLAHLLGQLLARAVRDGRVDAHSGLVGDVHRVLLERTLSVAQLFTFAYLVERAALEEVAAAEVARAEADLWPAAAQMVRRASFDLLAGYTERVELEPAGAVVVDRLTTLYSRAMLDAVLAKEVERAGRYGFPMSVILFDVDRLEAINQRYGYGVGDRVLERLGILIRSYFRQHDWVARYAEDAIAVLLSQTEGDQAADLAEHVRRTVEDRLWFTDHVTDQHVPVTVSAAVVHAQFAAGTMIDPRRLVDQAEAALDRAKTRGRNRVERIQV